MADYRIDKVKEYFLEKVLKSIDKDSNLNVNYLGSNIDDYSISKIPVENETEKWITGLIIKREVYNLMSTKPYSIDILNNIENLGVYEDIEKKIKDNNSKKILPDIKGIEEIKCLNQGGIVEQDTNTAIFSIQIQITYREVY